MTTTERQARIDEFRAAHKGCYACLYPFASSGASATKYTDEGYADGKHPLHFIGPPDLRAYFAHIGALQS